MSQVIALLHPGEMGTAIGACLRARGHRVLWVSAGRGAATRERAARAGLEECDTLGAALPIADFAVSVCPPHGALALAGEVAASGFQSIFLDGNAVSPATTRRIGKAVESAGASFVDGGIIGPPPAQSGRTRLYLAGGKARQVAALFEGTNLQTVMLEGEPGAASAIKACYAAWTKGTGALLVAIRALARHEGVEASLLEEWKQSQPDQARRAEWAAGNARKAWRWIGEMEEIAASFEAAGLPGEFHLAAAEIFRSLESFKDGNSIPPIEEVIGAFGKQSSAVHDGG